MLAMIVATRPTTRPSASIRCHFFSTSAGLADLVVFISAFMAFDPYRNGKRAARSGSAWRRYLRRGRRKSSKSARLHVGKIIPSIQEAVVSSPCRAHGATGGCVNRGAVLILRSLLSHSPIPRDSNVPRRVKDYIEISD